MVRQHGDVLIQIKLYGVVNSYLVREEDGFTAVDTGLPGSAAQMLRAAQSAGLPIRRVVLTHAHGDHVGGLDALKAAVPAAEVLISARDARLLGGDRGSDPAEPQAPIRGSFQRCRTVPDTLLHGGEQVGSLQVIAAPGHTPGHIALLDTRDGTLLAGDAFQTLGGLAVAGDLRPLFPLPALATWHAPAALDSARRLADLRPSRLAVGHGPVMEAPDAAVRHAIGRLERRLGQRLEGGVA